MFNNIKITYFMTLNEFDLDFSRFYYFDFSCFLINFNYYLTIHLRFHHNF